MTPVMHPVMPAALILLPQPGRQHARRLRRARSGAPRACPVDARRHPLAARRGLGAVARRLVVPDLRRCRRARDFPARLRRPGLPARVGRGDRRLRRRPRRGQRSRRHADARRLRRLRARHRRRRRARAGAGAARPGAGHHLAPPAAARGDRRRLGRLHDGPGRLLSRRRPHPAGDAALADDCGLRHRRHAGRQPAAGDRRRRPQRTGRFGQRRPVLLGHPHRAGNARLDLAAACRPDLLDPRGAAAQVFAPGRDRAAAALVSRRPDRACRTA